jgi:uncharacterized repeat protein (TIGR02543 family)
MPADNATIYAKASLTKVYDQSAEKVKEDETEVLAIGATAELDSKYVWYSDPDYQNLIDADSITVDENTTIYAEARLTLVYDERHDSTTKEWKSYKNKDYQIGTEVKLSENYIWYSDMDHKQTIDSVTMDKNTTVYALALLTMVYDQSDDPQTETQKYRVGDTATLTSDTYTWYSDKDLTTEITDPITMDTNKTVYAKAKTVTLTLVYDPLYQWIQSGTPDVTIEMAKGTEVDMEEVDSDYYWDTESGVKETRVTAPFNITEDTTLYAETTTKGAVETEKTVKLTLVYDQAWHNYGIGTNEDVIKEYTVGTEVDMTEVDGTYSWYEDEGFETLITEPFVMNEDKTIYASGTISGGGDVNPGTGTKIELYYNAMGGKIQGDGSCTRTFYQATDVNFDDPNYIPTKEGYVFAGWYKEPWYSTKVKGTVTVSESMNVFAKWDTAVTLKLVYDTLYTAIGVGTPDKTIVYAKGTTVDMTEVDGTYNWYEDGGLTKQITKPFTMTEDKTIYAGQTISGGGGSTNPTATTFYLSFQSNGGTYYSALPFTETTEVDLRKYTPTYAGHTFTGWYTDSNLTEKLGDTVTVSDNMTIWAGWTYNLTLVYDQIWHKYNAKNGYGTTPDVIYTYSGGTTVYLSKLDDTVVWYDSNSFKNIITEVTMNTDKTIYAKTRLTLVYDKDDSTKNVIKYWQYGTSGLNLSQHYGAVDWYEDEDFTKPIATIDMDANKTVYARARLTKVYDQSDNKSKPDDTEYYKVDETVDLTESNYIWYADEEYTELITSVNMDANKTIYAKKQKVTLTMVYDQSNPSANKTQDYKVGTTVNRSELDGTVAWYADANYQTPITDSFTMDADKTIYAKARLTMVYVQTNAEKNETKDCKIGETVTLSEGYVWYSDPECTNPITSVTVNKNTTVYAKARLTMVYVQTNAEKNETKDCKIGDTVTLSEDYIWYSDPECTKPITSITVNKNTTVYAKVCLTLVYNYKSDAGEAIPNVTMVFPVNTKVDMNTLEISGHETDRVDWYAKLGDSSSKITEITMDTNKTIYAEKQKVTLTLVYDPLYHITGGGTPDVTIAMDVGTVVDMNTLEIPDHENDGAVSWYTQSGDPDSIITGTFTMTADKTIYAGASAGGGDGDVETTEPTTFHLSYNSNGGSYIRARTFTEPTKVDFEDPNYIPTRDGYTFTGWYTDSSLTTRLNGTQVVSNEMTVFAGWKEEVKKVTLTLVYGSANQQTGGMPNVTITYSVGDTVNLEVVAPGYSWDKTSGDPETRVTKPFVITEDTTLYAETTTSGSKGEEEPEPSTEINLTYDAGKGTIRGDSIYTRTLEKAGTVDFEDKDYIPTRDGYTFTGWYAEDTLETKLGTDVTVSADMTVYAGWKVNEPIVVTPTDPEPEPSEEPSTEPSEEPSTEPSEEPSTEPSEEPSAEPSEEPSTEPSEEPSTEPSTEPSEEPSTEPSEEPSTEPSTEPSEEPSTEPSEEPSTEPSEEPSTEPSEEPSTEPSTEPSEEPSTEPSEEPSTEPSEEPSTEPSEEPSTEPTEEPSTEPSEEPSVAPTTETSTSTTSTTESGTKTETTTTTSQVAQTGDQSHLTLWVVLLVLSVVGLTVLVGRRKKRSK